MTTILVTGATGTLGQMVAERLCDHLASEHAGGTVTFEEFLDRRHRHPA
ncbi:hypothetical protein ACFVSX_21380 [Streptomyces rubiginosohelvolus]